MCFVLALRAKWEFWVIRCSLLQVQAICQVKKVVEVYRRTLLHTRCWFMIDSHRLSKSLQENEAVKVSQQHSLPEIGAFLFK